MATTTWDQKSGMTSATDVDNLESYAEQAEASATSAASSASAASSSASAAATSEANASTSEASAASSAASSATSAETAETAEAGAVAAQAAAEAAYDDFDDRYLGAKSSAPSTDNDGSALITGALYFDTTAGGMYVWNGSSWAALTGAAAGVTTFNTRSGAVTLTSTDVNTALGSDAVLDSDIGSTVQAYSAVLSGTTASFTTADETKLDGIEAGADVTDAANVEPLIDAHLNYSTATSGQLLSFNGTDYDWVDVAGTGTVTSVAATVPTGFSISGSPITAAGTLAISYSAGYQGYTSTEASKLAGIEAGADVTDTANVTAAGALMDSEVTNLAAVKTFDPTDYATAAQGALADSATQPGDNISTLTNDSGFTTNTGTVTSVAASAGTGISISGSPITTSGTLTITNTAPDQTVSIVGSGAITVSGTYPNFEVATPGYTDSDVNAHLNTSTASTGEILSWNGSDYDWIAAGGSGTVTSVAATVPTGFTVSGSPITSSGTLAISYSAGYQGYTTTEASKLAGIEAGADVTDTTNVTAAGALMDSELTDLAGVKALDTSTLATLTGTQTLTNKTLTAPTITGTVIEDVYALSGTTPALEPANGSVQTWTLSGNSTPTDSLAAGEAITLMINDGTAYTITWPTMTWVNNAGSAPTLATSGYTVVALWKVSTTLYGALVGDGT